MRNKTSFLLLSVLLGIFLPQAGEPLKPFILPVLAFLLFFVGLKVDLKETAESLKNPKPILFLLFVNIIIMPLFYYIFASALLSDLQIIVGFVLLGSTSVAVSSSVWTMLSGGDVKLPLSTTVINILLVPLTLPLTVYLFFQRSVQFDIVSNFIKLFLTVVVPLFAGYMLKKKKENAKDYAQFSVIPLSIVLYIITAVNAEKVFSTTSLIITLILTIKIVFCAILAFFGSKGLKKEPASLFFPMTTKNRSVASAVALSSFTELVALPMAISSVVDTIVNILAVRYFKKKR